MAAGAAAQDTQAPATPAIAVTGTDTPDAGAYLAARNAAGRSDYAAAGKWYDQAREIDPGNPALLEGSVIAYLAMAQIDDAKPIAQELRDGGFGSQVGNMVLIADAARRDDWVGIVADIDAGQGVSPLFDGLTKAWATLGLGNMTEALAAFDAVIATDGMAPYGRFHKALALASVGDYEGADAILADPGPGATAFSPRAVIARAQVLSQMGRNADAIAALDVAFGATMDPQLADLRTRLEGDDPIPFDIVTSPRDGVAEVAFMIASLLAVETREDYTLQYARVAQLLAPQNADAAMLSAALLQNLDQYDLASAAFAQVPQDAPAFVNAELGRIDTLRKSGDTAVATEVAQSLARTHPDLPFVQSKLGDVLRDAGDLTGAVTAYSAALDLYPDADPNRWVVLYTRGVVHHDLDQWTAAESDFRAALALNPDQPQVLNYLGYSLVERGEKLDEALGMIERAVADQPDNGAIVDSLGWVYFQLGRYEDAIDPMEKAASLEATDAVVNDHLGDAYWAVGRVREARFQWQRSLSFDPDPELAARIRAKLDRGLDAVRSDEGLAPTGVAADPTQ
ncbi:MAG: tetratricopeptide repeat protein [Alphaproteobacteria bacterium]|nr:tetratricopeptide repeat protein [Alphaproteobacteria bacterium]